MYSELWSEVINISCLGEERRMVSKKARRWSLKKPRGNEHFVARLVVSEGFGFPERGCSTI